MPKNKSQASFEFIMTYGWGIIIALVALGALAYYGILSPDNFAPQQCTLPPGITCLDVRVESKNAVVVLQNNLGRTITVSQIIVADDINKCTDDSTIILENGMTMIADAQCDNSFDKRRFIGNVNVTYELEGGLSHTTRGYLKAKVEDTSSAVNITKQTPNPIVIEDSNRTISLTRAGTLPDLYNITLQEPNGISFFLILNSARYALSGGLTTCLKKATLGPFSIRANEFPVTAYYNDCNNKKVTHIANASMP